jgi:hypothetical protein
LFLHRILFTAIYNILYTIKNGQEEGAEAAATAGPAEEEVTLTWFWH